VVKNQAHSEHFRLYERSESRQRLLNEFGGREIIIPRMYDWIVAGLNEHDLTTAAAMTHPAIMFFDRCRIANWKREFHEQLGQVSDLLLPDGIRVKQPSLAAKWPRSH
jgi:hypothetical protein